MSDLDILFTPKAPRRKTLKQELALRQPAEVVNIADTASFQRFAQRPEPVSHRRERSEPPLWFFIFLRAFPPMCVLGALAIIIFYGVR